MGHVECMGVFINLCA